MIMCLICGTWMIRKWITDSSGFVCYYYDYCPKCNPEEVKEVKDEFSDNE